MELLTRIANELRDKTLATKEPARHELGGGLRLTYLITGDTHQLSLTRWAQMPSQTERELVRTAFNVPSWVTYKDYEFEYIRGWGIMRIKWTNSRRLKLIKLGQAHLAPGWSEHRLNQLLAHNNLTDWNKADDRQLDALLAEIYGADQ